MLGQNLSTISRDAFHFRQTSTRENSSLLALLLLQHQVQSSQVAECAIRDQPNFVILEKKLIINTLEDTFYVNTPGQAEQFRPPQKWRLHPSNLLLLDDCVSTRKVAVEDLKSALNSTIIFPVSISLITIKTYTLNPKKQLTVQTNEGDHTVLFDSIAEFTLTALANDGVQINIIPEGFDEAFSLKYTPAL